MDVWVVVSRSCADCDTISVASFDHEPTEGEKDTVTDSCGGMYCIGTFCFKTEINGEPVDD